MTKKPKTAPAVVTARSDETMRRIETGKGTIVTIPGVKTDVLTTLVIGTAPLMVHHFSQKSRDKIRRKHEGEASGGREPKDCIANFEGARYRLSDGSDGCPAGGWKACIIDGFDKGCGVVLKNVKGAIRVRADDPAANLVRIIHPEEPPHIASLPHFIDETGRIPRCREDVVRNESGVVDIRHRPEFWPWAALLTLEFLPSVASARQVLQAVAVAGFRVGQCEWRPASKESKSGSYGTFRLATPEEVQAFADDRLFEDYEWPAFQVAAE